MHQWSCTSKPILRWIVFIEKEYSRTNMFSIWPLRRQVNRSQKWSHCFSIYVPNGCFLLQPLYPHNLELRWRGYFFCIMPVDVCHVLVKPPRKRSKSHDLPIWRPILPGFCTVASHPALWCGVSCLTTCPKNEGASLGGMEPGGGLNDIMTPSEWVLFMTQ